MGVYLQCLSFRTLSMHHCTQRQLLSLVSQQDEVVRTLRYELASKTESGPVFSSTNRML